MGAARDHAVTVEVESEPVDLDIWVVQRARLLLLEPALRLVGIARLGDPGGEPRSIRCSQAASQMHSERSRGESRRSGWHDERGSSWRSEGPSASPPAFALFSLSCRWAVRNSSSSGSRPSDAASA